MSPFAPLLVAPLLVAAVLLPAAARADPPGDRRLDLHIQYPPEAYFHNGRGGTVLDITKAPFHAAGDGETDDTAAFVRAYDFILTEQDKIGYSGTGMLITDGTRQPEPDGYPVDEPPVSADGSFIIYVPDGTYRLSDTIIYSMPDRTPAKRREATYKRGVRAVRNAGWERLIWARFVGESRDGTVLKLADRSPGFGPGAEKAVLSFGKSGFNNRKALSCVHNLTIDAGSGNPGAVGVDFTGANSAQLTNLTIKSGDGAGSAGVLMRRPPVLGASHDLTVEGFDYGLRSRVGHASAPAFEYVTLKNQNEAGVLLEAKRPGEGGSGAAVLLCRKTAIASPGGRRGGPAVQLTGPGVHFVATACAFDRCARPVERRAGAAYLHDCTFIGVEDGVTGPARPLPERSLPEASSPDPPGDLVAGVFHLKPLEAPRTMWPAGPEEWDTPEAHGAVAGDGIDDTAAVQAAFDGGKPCVFLCSARYELSGSIVVPASVRWVNGLWRHNPDLELRVAGPAAGPATFTQFYRGRLSHECPRTVCQEFGQLIYSNTPAARGGTLFVVNGSYPTGRRNPAGVAFYGRSVNNEDSGLPLTIAGGEGRGPVWVLGLKTERGPALRLTNDARVEILGAAFGVKTGSPPAPGTPGEPTPGEPAIVVEAGSALTLVANKSADRWEPGQVVIEATTPAGRRTVTAADLPPRQPDDGVGGLIPLFTTGSPR